ncbi:MAG: MFS transporter [Myxococcota bacterium]
MFFIAVLISFFTGQLYLISILIIARDIAGERMADMADALVLVTSFLPALLLTPIAGHIVDRFDRKRILIISKACDAVITLTFLTSSAQLNLWFFLTLNTLTTIFFVFFIVTTNSLIPSIYKNDEFPAVNVLINVTRAFMLILGALGGGFLADRIAHDLLFFVCACLHALTAILLAWVRIRQSTTDSEQQPKHARTNFPLDAFAQGLAYLKQDTYILLLIAARTVMNIGAGLRLLYIAMAEEVLRLGDHGLGLFAAARGVGFFIGPFAAARMGSAATAKHHALITGGLASLGIGFGLLGVLGGHNIWLSGATIILAFAGSACVKTISITLIHRAAHNEFLGRVLALDTGLGALAEILATLLLGFILGPRTVIPATVVSGILLVAAAIAWNRFADRHFRLPTPPARDN